MFGGKRPARAASSVRHLLKRGAAKLGRLGRHDGGTVVVIAGIIFPVVVGGMGLGVETGYWYFTQRKLQHAADVSVYAAAVRKSQQDSKAQYEEVALRIAEQAGFNTSAGSIEVNSPPQSPSAYAGDADAVQVILNESLPRLFTSIFTGEPLTLSGRAVALVQEGSDGCVLALHATQPEALKLSGGAELTLQGCDVASNSNASTSISMSNNSKLTTGCVNSVGGASMSQGLNLTDCEQVKEFSRRTPDPYADVAEPAEQGACENRNFNPNQTYNLQPKQQGHPSGLPTYRFCGSVDFKGTVNFGPGLYIFSCPNSGNCGNVSVTATAGAELNGSNVTFYLASGIGMDFRGNATINLSARTEDPYAGILFFSSRQGPAVSHTVNGGAGGYLEGAVYFPTGNIEYSGGANASGGCTQIIGSTVEFKANSQIGSNCEGKGTRRIAVNELIRIVE